ncbi:hypothetical protein CEXT_708961 [Caerostris extrusa]|uniref:Uncharacterized protein n=1 Tax=Caerostris extrusa TaxID=172846 RepID=A0AAV4W2J5_CAEEX|nr:hypothetical protein CEXT_708961 [Caerostris extrusa]
MLTQVYDEDNMSNMRVFEWRKKFLKAVKKCKNDESWEDSNFENRRKQKTKIYSRIAPRVLLLEKWLLSDTAIAV